MIASLSRTVTAPATPRSSSETGLPCLFRPMTTRPARSRRSFRLVVRARMAISSLETVMSKPVLRGKIGLGEPSASLSSLKPIWISRRLRSQTSTTRFQVMAAGSMSSRRRPRLASPSSDWRLSWYMRLSIAAATRLWAMLMA